MFGDNAATATDTTMTMMKDLISQFANIRFEGALMYVILMLIAGLICVEGYRIYRMALAVIGFAVGYSQIHNFVEAFGIEMTDETMFMVQVIAGIVCAALAYTALKIGIFIAVYHFVQANLSAGLAALLAEKLNIPALAYPLFAMVAGALIASLIAYLSTKAEKTVVMAVTAVMGAFAVVVFFVKLIPVSPVDLSFLDDVPDMGWTVVKVILAILGFMVQSPKKEK